MSWNLADRYSLTYQIMMKMVLVSVDFLVIFPAYIRSCMADVSEHKYPWPVLTDGKILAKFFLRV